MKSNFLFIISILIMIILASGCTSFSQSPISKNPNIPPASIQEIEAMHLNMSVLDIPRLREIAASPQMNPDNRKKAIFALTDISINTNSTEEARQVLKTIAITEHDSVIRTAAYANLDLINQIHPPERVGDLQIRIDGAIRQGTNVTLVAEISSTIAVNKTLFGVTKIVEGEKGITDGIVMIDPPKWPVRYPMNARQTREIPVSLSLQREGEYQIVCLYQQDIDRADYRRIRKEIFLTVGKNSGNYTVTETPPEF